MNIHRKVGPFPVWAWGVAIAGGLVLGIYLRRRAKSRTATTDPNAALGALTNATGFGVASPNAGLDNSGIISGLLQQNSDALSAILALAGGGSPPAISDPATFEPQASPLATSTSPLATPTASFSAPTVNIASSSADAAPTAVVTSDNPVPPSPPPPDPNYPNSYLGVGGTVMTGETTPQGLPIEETQAVAAGAEPISAASSSTGGLGGAGYFLMSDKTIRPSLGTIVMV